MKRIQPTDPTAQEFIDSATDSFRNALTEAINKTAVLFCFEVGHGHHFSRSEHVADKLAFIVMPCPPQCANDIITNISAITNTPILRGKQTNAKQN